MKLRVYIYIACLAAVLAHGFGSPAEARVLRTWLLCGPFEGSLDKEAFAGEKDLAPAAGQSAGGRVWKVYSALDSAVDLMNESAIGVHNNSNAYAYAEITSPADKYARLLLGSDDGVKVWFNGVLILHNDVPRGVILEQDKLIVRLKKGKNRLLMKVNNLGGGWYLSANITGMDGKNIPGLSFNPEQDDLMRMPVERIIYSAIQGDDIKQFSPAFLIDGFENTRWSSGFSDQEKVTFDFGEPQTVTRVALVWENAFSSSYELLSSPDGEQWSRVYFTDKGKGGREDMKIQARDPFRYLRISFLKRATAWGNSLFEVYIFGKGKKEYPADYYQRSLKTVRIEKDRSVKQPLEISSYPKKIQAGSQAEVEVEWTEAPSNKDYKLVVQLENWDLKPGVCQSINVEGFEPKGKKIVKISVPSDAPRIEGYRLVAAFMSKTKNWDDTKMVVSTPKEIEVIE